MNFFFFREINIYVFSIRKIVQEETLKQKSNKISVKFVR